jgi:hypothetical protein
MVRLESVAVPFIVGRRKAASLPPSLLAEKRDAEAPLLGFREWLALLLQPFGQFLEREVQRDEGKDVQSAPTMRLIPPRNMHVT